MKKSVDPLTADLTSSSIHHGRSAAPASSTEAALADILADLLHLDTVPAISNFFEDLGADSMVMAQFCARVRRRPELPSVSMKDIYQHPTIAGLATALAPRPSSAPAPVPAPAPAPVGEMLAEVLADLLHVGSVPVDSSFFEDLGADSMVMAQFCARVRKRPELPAVSMKDIYQHPTIAGLATALAPRPGSAPPPIPATGPVEGLLAEVLADIVHTQVPVDSNFFDDLGADSMVMAQFCAQVRKRPELPAVSMKDIYQHPTIAGLAAALAPAAAVPDASAELLETSTSGPERSDTSPAVGPTHTSSRQYVVCGVLQLLIFVAYSYLGAYIATQGFNWISGTTETLGIYLRSVVFAGLSFLVLVSLPIVAKWVLIGRWKPTEIPVWSLTYLRFWIVKTLVRSNPLVLVMGGSPLYTLYLRALGANVGRGVAIFTRSVPVCTDLLSIGDNTVIRKEAVINGYRAQSGVIRTGPVTIGKDVFVGEKTVLDIDTSLGDRSQLGHASSVHPGQVIPQDERWHGSPAERASVDYRTVEPARLSSLRRVVYATQQLLMLLLVWLPLGFGGMTFILAKVPRLGEIMDPGTLAAASPSFYRDVLAASLVLFFGSLLVALVFIASVPRLLARVVTPDRVYPLYSFSYSVHRVIARATNSKFFTYLYGDSSYIVGYLRWIGYDMRRPIQQTGSNFGTMVTHESPYLSSIGSGTMVADGLSMMNADFSSTSFRVSRVSVGSHNFLGNTIAYPAQARTGDNCLLATKVMIPIDGPLRENVGLLGSPSFEIPRSVQRDSALDPAGRGELRRLLKAKNRYNVRTMGLALLVRWVHFFTITLLAMVAADVYRQVGATAIVADVFVTTLFTMAYFVFVERAIVRFRRLRPQYCSIYDPYFWWHERFWKLVIPPFDRMLVGTPFKNIVSRRLGVRMGKRVFDDGCSIVERTLTTVGDECTLNAGSTIQCHSQEDGTFKSDYSTIGNGCTLGAGALVHYGVTMGDGSVLAADAFLMKGEEVPAHAHWGGNPAREMPDMARWSSVAGDDSRRDDTAPHAAAQQRDEQPSLVGTTQGGTR